MLCPRTRAPPSSEGSNEDTSPSGEQVGRGAFVSCVIGSPSSFTTRAMLGHKVPQLALRVKPRIICIQDSECRTVAGGLALSVTGVWRGFSRVRRTIRCEYNP